MKPSDSLTRVIQPYDSLTSIMQPSGWLTSVMQPSDWLTSVMQPSDWLINSIMQPSDWLTSVMQPSDWLVGVVQPSDWLTKVYCMLHQLSTSILVTYCDGLDKPISISMFVIQDIVRGESYLLLRPDRVAMQDATAQVGVRIPGGHQARG